MSLILQTGRVEGPASNEDQRFPAPTPSRLQRELLNALFPTFSGVNPHGTWNASLAVAFCVHVLLLKAIEHWLQNEAILAPSKEPSS